MSTATTSHPAVIGPTRERGHVRTAAAAPIPSSVNTIGSAKAW